MASSLNSITCSSYLHPPQQPSPLSCGEKVFVGLRLQSPNSYGIARPNLCAELHKKIHKSIEP
ncbi:hypothetical protein Tco_0041960, partial [Tanacetum coccineum]